jgi:ATP-dependent helicase HrpA
VDPKLARELFIRHALVRMEYDARAPFLAREPASCCEDTEYLQQKGRRVDLLVDETRLFEFFEARVPEVIATGAAFERWRRDAEREGPEAAVADERDIAASDAVLEAERFPIICPPVRSSCGSRYRFDPGHEDDGVSALVPLHVLNQLSEEPFSWLVPGLLEEKITALVRSLPKALRVHFVPVPEAVAKVMPLLEPGRGSLVRAAGRGAVGAPAACRCRASAFREDGLPPHLRMNFHLLDDAGTVVARSRSARGAAGAPRRRRAAATTRSSRSSRRGARRWVFGDLPERIDAAAGGRLSSGSRARGRGRERRPARVRDAAGGAPAHERGTARLIRLVLSRDLKPLRRDLAVNVQAEIAYRGLAAHPLLDPDLAAGRDLRDDLLDRVVMTVFLEGREPLRRRRGVRRAGRRRRGAVGLLAQEMSRSVQRPSSSSRRCCRGSIARRRLTAADLRGQLAWLVPAGFLLVTPWERLQEFPRYLKALLQRLEKLAQRSPPGRAARRRDRAARGALARAHPHRARPAVTGRGRLPLAARGVARVAVRAAAEDEAARLRETPCRRLGRPRAKDAGVRVRPGGVWIPRAPR